MNAELIHPELRAAFTRLPRLPFHNRLFVAIFRMITRLAPTPAPGPGIAIENRTMTRAGVRIYRPGRSLSKAGLLWMHGGGLISGHPAMDDGICAALARDLDLVVVSVRYRLAPRHPYPAAIDDCVEGWEWLRRSARDLGIDPTRVVVAGQSAGAGLAACLAQRILDAGSGPPAAQVLFCPMLDDRTATRYELDGIDHPLWNNRSNRAAWEWYLGRPAGLSAAPPYAVAARREDLAGLPPTWITVGDIDLFFDEDRRYADRLQEAGVACRLHISPHAPHSFQSLVPDAELSRRLFLSLYEFLGQVLGLAPLPARCSYGRGAGAPDPAGAPLA